MSRRLLAAVGLSGVVVAAFALLVPAIAAPSPPTTVLNARVTRLEQRFNALQQTVHTLARTNSRQQTELTALSERHLEITTSENGTEVPPGGSSTAVLAPCPRGTTQVGGGFDAAPGTVVTQSSSSDLFAPPPGIAPPEPAPGPPPYGWTVTVHNTATDTALALAEEFCLGPTPPNG